jgi:hypothetical protein
LNVRGSEAWRHRKQRVSEQKMITAVGMRGCRLVPPVRIGLVRVAPRMLDAHDNLPASLKSCADSVAAHFGVDDRHASCWRFRTHRLSRLR